MSADDRYRADVDGLRAVAVLAVILFHLDKALLPGGFVGVDVFFVISGFLITRNIVGEIGRGTFSVAEFYRRRIKRIAPAMLVVVTATLVLSQLLFLPEDARETAKSAVWSLASMANVYFWLYQDTGYFAADSAHAPLLHLWSLGIEEQFYLCWPLLLWAFYRRGREVRLVVASLLALAFSFALGELLATRAPSFSYYMLPTRAGELLAGGLVAIAGVRGGRGELSRLARSACTVLGAALLVASFLLLDERLPFPGLYAIGPTLGAVLLIVGGAGQRPPLATRALSARPMVGIGLVSYSAYLWHWPLLAFYRYAYGEPRLASGAAIVALTFGLAWLTYRWVEQPVRHSRASAMQVAVRFFAAPGLALLVAALVLVYPSRLGVELQSRSYLSALADLRTDTQPAFQFEWVCQRQRVTAADAVDPRCVLGSGTAAPQAILWGDSNAAHYIGIVDAIAHAAGFRFRNLEVGSCPPLDGDPAPFVELSRLADCRASLALVGPVIDRYPVVMVSASWSTYQERDERFLERFFQTVRDLTGKGKLVILIGKAPVMEGYDRLCREKALSYPLLACRPIMRPTALAVPAINARLRAFAERTPDVRYFDATRFLCPHDLCAAGAVDGKPLYYDASHLTAKASAALGQIIVAADGVPAAFTGVSTWPAPAR